MQVGPINIRILNILYASKTAWDPIKWFRISKILNYFSINFTASIHSPIENSLVISDLRIPSEAFLTLLSISFDGV